MNGVPMKFDYSKTINEQLPTFDYYKNRYISYELELMNNRKEIERLNNKYNKALELLVDYNLPCEMDDFNTTTGLDYCSKYCSVDEEIYKKCWDKFIEWKLGSDK